jgi:hypothetical protein
MSHNWVVTESREDPNSIPHQHVHLRERASKEIAGFEPDALGEAVLSNMGLKAGLNGWKIEA